jgi:nucleoside-diphosphate-sugar epimerase
MTRLLITGANGFVGRGVCERLSKYPQFTVAAAVRHRVEDLIATQFPVGTIHAQTDWRDLLEQVDIVIHLAARVHLIKDTCANPLAEFRRVNLDSTTNLARQAASAGVKRFVYLSSIKVNGEATTAAPFSASDRPAPQDPYGISKWESEQALHAISADSGMEVVIIRPPLVYGPGVKANFLALLGIVNRALPLPLGQVHNHRSMVYLGNLVDAIYHSAIDPRAAGKTFLVADGQDVSTPELIRMLAAAMGRPYRVFDFPVKLLRGLAALIGKSSSIDRLTQSLVVDSSEIRQQLHWSPPYTLDQGLQETVDWYLHKVQSR